MWSKDFWQRIEGRIVLFIGQFIVLVACLSYIAYHYNFDVLPDKLAKRKFHETNCFITSKKLSAHGSFFRTYRADFLISYNVNSVQYNRWVSGNGLDTSYTQNESEQEDILSQFDVGRMYHCWYDPDNPQLSILVPRHNWLSIFPLILPAIIGIIVLYYALKSLFKLMTLAPKPTSTKITKLKRKRTKTKKKRQ